MNKKSVELKDQPFEFLVNHGCRIILEEVLAGKRSLWSAIYATCDVAARWGRDNEKAVSTK